MVPICWAVLDIVYKNGLLYNPPALCYTSIYIWNFPKTSQSSLVVHFTLSLMMPVEV